MPSYTPDEEHARLLVALRGRRAGLTYKAIGAQLGVGVEQARQLYFKAERREWVADYHAERAFEYAAVPPAPRIWWPRLRQPPRIVPRPKGENPC